MKKLHVCLFEQKGTKKAKASKWQDLKENLQLLSRRKGRSGINRLLNARQAGRIEYANDGPERRCGWAVALPHCIGSVFRRGFVGQSGNAIAEMAVLREQPEQARVLITAGTLQTARRHRS